MSRAEKVIVIGGGISGLSSAVALADAGFSVKLFEKRNSLGGLIGTRRSTYGLAEAAANGIYNSISVEKFCRRLGVPLKGTLSSARARYIFVGGKARKWPIILPMSESLRFFFKLGFYRFFNRQKLVPQTNQRVSDWADKYFGGRVAHDVLSPILQGVYAAEAKDLSASLLLKGFFENKRRERKPTLRGTVAPLGGMGELIEALERAAYESNVDIIEGKAYEWEEWDNGKVPHVLDTSASQ
ncbi:MAG: FAD-dependent oxidoreductase, partial [Bdellovibrionales bacterium]|nr:FAD-dependent oxidoreductase [Bdellovibrionales bacterium]